MDENILRGNKLIAEFMGATVKNVLGRPAVFWDSSGHPNKPTFDGASLENYKYHFSWDWLIPVIDKIYSSNEYVQYKNEASGQFETEIFINVKFIENTWQDVIDFIEWYNKNKDNG